MKQHLKPNMQQPTVSETIASQTQDVDSVDEILDLVDVTDCVVRTMGRKQVYQQNLCAQMRSVWLMIRNQDGQLWIPRRSMTVDRLPGHLDGSVVGHVKSGETYEQALVRETYEEAGLELQPGSYKLLGKLTPHEHNTFCFSMVYELEVRQAPSNWNRDDIGQWYWMTPHELLERCIQGDKFKDTLLVVIRNFYSNHTF